MWMSLKEIILQVVDWWPLVLLIFCSQWGRGEPVFCTYRGHLPYWQHICGVKKIFWLLSYDVCVCVCVLAHLLKPQRLSEILVCEDALDDARETASFHPFVLKGMWNAVREKHFSNLDLHFNSPHIDLTYMFCRPTDGMFHFWLPLYLKAKSRDIDNIDQGLKHF